MEIGGQRHDDVVTHVVQKIPESLGQKYVEVWVSQADQYSRGASNLHIHGSWRGDDFCAVARAQVSRGGARSPSDNGAVIHCRPRFRLAESSPSDRQLSVSVLVGQPVEYVESQELVKFPGVGWWTDSTLERLDPLQDCDGIRMHLAGGGNPALSALRSLLILPLDLRDIPDRFGNEWEHDVAAFRGRDQGAGEVFQRGPDVVEEVPSEQRDIAVRGGSEGQSPNVSLLLALDRVAHRIWVGICKAREEPFEVDEVMFGSAELESEVWNLKHHELDLVLEGDARRRAGTGADPRDASGTHHPGADS